jgi:hypothetical protein
MINDWFLYKIILIIFIKYKIIIKFLIFKHKNLFYSINSIFDSISIPFYYLFSDNHPHNHRYSFHLSKSIIIQRVYRHSHLSFFYFQIYHIIKYYIFADINLLYPFPYYFFISLTSLNSFIICFFFFSLFCRLYLIETLSS